METSWPNAFPRLAELQRDDAQPGRSGFFDGIPLGIRSPLGFESYSELEQDLAALDHQAWTHFKQAVLQCPLDSHSLRGYSRVLERLFEAKGYVYLRELGYRTVEFIPRSRKQGKRTPDLRAYSPDMVAAILEVKTIWQSDDETRYVLENTKLLGAGQPPICKRLTPEIPAGLKGKLLSTLEQAADQLLSFEPDLDAKRIAFLVIHLDHGPLTSDKSYLVIPQLLREHDQRIDTVCRFRAT